MEKVCKVFSWVVAWFMLGMMPLLAQKPKECQQTSQVLTCVVPTPKPKATPLPNEIIEPVTTEADPIDLNGLVEKNKRIIKIFKVEGNDQLQVFNQHGEIKVNLWKRNEIKVEINIQGFASTEEKALAYIDEVKIAEQRVGNKIMLKTEITPENTSNKWWGNWSWADKSDVTNNKQCITVDYEVFMPNNMPLLVSNKYGNISIVEFSAPLIVHTIYGNFTCDKLSGNEKEIQVQYGKAAIRQVDEASLRVAYSDLNVDKANVLKLKNNFGTITLDQVNQLEGNIQYSTGKIGVIRENANLNLSYSDLIELQELPKTLKSLTILSNFTAVKLPVSTTCNFNFDVTVNNAHFKYPTNKVYFTVNPDGSNAYNPSKTNTIQSLKNYKGRTGDGTGTKVVIRSNYGGVRFSEKE